MGGPKIQQTPPNASTPTAAGYNNLLQGQLGPSGGINTTLTNLLSGQPGNSAYTTPQMPNAPGFSSTQFSGLNNNLDLSQFSPGSNAGGAAGLSFNNVMSAPVSSVGGMQGNIPNFNAMQGLNYGVGNVNMPSLNVNSQPATAIENYINQQNQIQNANTRAQFAAGGMGSEGTGAGFALAQQQALGNTALAQNLAQINQQNVGNTLGFGQLNSQNTLQAQGLAQSGLLGQLGLQNQSQLGNFQIGQAGQIANQQAQLAQLGQAIQAAGMGAGLNLQGLGMGASNALNQFGANNTATQTMNQNAFSQNSALNQFMQQLFGQQSGNALGLGSLGLQNQGQQLSGQLGSLQALFGGLNNSNQLGQAPVQNYAQPNAFSSFINALGSGLGALSNFSNPFSGNGLPSPNSQLPTGQTLNPPNLGLPPVSNTTGSSGASSMMAMAPGSFNFSPTSSLGPNNVPPISGYTPPNMMNFGGIQPVGPSAVPPISGMTPPNPANPGMNFGGASQGMNPQMMQMLQQMMMSTGGMFA